MVGGHRGIELGLRGNEGHLEMSLWSLAMNQQTGRQGNDEVERARPLQEVPR